MLVSFLLAAAAAFDPWMTFDRSPSFFHEPVTVSVATLRVGDRFYYEFKRAVGRENGDQISWTDTKRCPQATEVLIAATHLERPAVSVPFLLGNDLVLTSDGTEYHLKADAQYGEHGLGDIEFSSNVGTPLANWIDDSLKALESCWKSNRLQR